MLTYFEICTNGRERCFSAAAFSRKSCFSIAVTAVGSRRDEARIVSCITLSRAFLNGAGVLSANVTSSAIPSSKLQVVVERRTIN